MCGRSRWLVTAMTCALTALASWLVAVPARAEDDAGEAGPPAAASDAAADAAADASIDAPAHASTDAAADTSADASSDAPAGTSADASVVATATQVPELPVPPGPRMRMALADVLKVALDKGREARLALEQLGAAFQAYKLVRADYHVAGVANANTDEKQALSLAKKFNQGTKLSMDVTRVGTDPEVRTFTVDKALFINNAFDVRRAELEYAIAREQYRVRIEDFKLDVIRRFLDLVRAQERLRTLLAGVQRNEDLVAAARARFELGLTSKIDILNTSVDLANARNQVIAQRQTVDRVRDELVDLVGLPLDAPVDAVDPLDIETPPEPDDGWYRSEIEIERARVEQVRTRMNEARLRTFPDISVRGTLTDQDGKAAEALASVTYGFPIGTAPLDHVFRGLRHDYEAAQYQLKNREFQIAREQRDIRRTLRTKRESVRIAAQAVANAAESYQASQISFQRGLISNIDLRVAQSNLTSARDNYISLLIDYRLAYHTYRRLFGGKL